MKSVIASLLVLLFINQQAKTQSPHSTPEKLYPISENDLWGYINIKGEVVIKPSFLSAGNFTEELAPVRLNGTHGYINLKNELVIPYRYDVAYNFHNGIAKVYLEGKPYFINTKGEILFEHSFLNMNQFSNEGVSIVSTEHNTFGLINRKGNLVLDTIYKEITPFYKGVAQVTGREHYTYSEKDKSKRKYEVGLINATGSFIIPFGQYNHIHPFINGFAEVEFDRKNSRHNGIIDHRGNLMFTMQKLLRFPYYSELFTEGLATIDIYTVDTDTMDHFSGSDRYSYKGVIDASGKVVFSNKYWKTITPFHNGRAFAENTNNQWFLINNRGETLNTEPYKDILYSVLGRTTTDNTFHNGIDFVRIQEGWIGIDVNGNQVTKARYPNYPPRYLERVGDIIITQKESSLIDPYNYLYGMWDTKKDTLIAPQFHYVALPEELDKPIYVVKHGQMGYINRKGEYLWKEKKKVKHRTQKLNIDYMKRGYFHAVSMSKELIKDDNSWAASQNLFDEIPIINNFRLNELNMLVERETTPVPSSNSEKISLYLANMEKDTLFFNAQDLLLYLRIQAKDEKGKWRDIEYSPRSWCGNSYHTLFLPPNYFWKFTIPQYKGQFKTKLRAQLFYLREQGQEEEHIIFSNEFDGSVNPGQFWRKKAYYPSGIMNPYYN